MPKSRVLNVPNMSFNVIRENKISAKISEYTVYKFNLYCLNVDYSKSSIIRNEKLAQILVYTYISC